MLTPRISSISISSHIFKNLLCISAATENELWNTEFLTGNNRNEMENHTPKHQMYRKRNTSGCFPLSLFNSSFQLTVWPFKAVHFCFLVVVSAVPGLFVYLLPFSLSIICFQPKARCNSSACASHTSPAFTQQQWWLNSAGKQGKANCSLTTNMTKKQFEKASESFKITKTSSIL